MAKYTYDAPPGTDKVDQDGKEHEVHYPMPSDSIHDPLSWSPFWKYLTFSIGVWWIFWSTLPTLAISSLYGPIIQEYHMTPTEISQSGGWFNLVLALACLVFMPYANMYGRRPMLLFTNLIQIAGSIWFTLSKDHINFLWSRNVQAVGAAAIETLSLALVGDLFFTQEAGLYHALGFAPLILAVNLGSPVAGAFESYGVGWRNFFWFSTATLIATQFIIYFLMPETLWPRTIASARGHVVHEAGSTEFGQAEKTSSQVSLPASESKSDNVEAGAAIAPAVSAVVKADVIANVGKGYPSKTQRWAIFPKRNKHYSLKRNAYDTLVLSTFGPVIIFCLWWAAIGGSAVAQGFVAAQLWEAPPYLFGPAAVGCTNIPPVIATILGLVVAGKVCDMDLAAQAKRNGGIREPEMRLRTAIFGGIASVIGLIIYAVGLQRSWHWAIVLIPGSGLNSFANAFCVTAASSYSTDVYKQFPIEIAFLATLVKNLWTFGLGYFINDLLLQKGPLLCIVMISIPIYFVIVFTTAFLWVGKPLRRISGRMSIMTRED